MDAFRLLSRSTKLAKSSVPSIAPSNELADNKRQRAQDIIPSKAIDPELDFFSEHQTGIKTPANKRSIQKSSALDDNSRHVKIVADSEPQSLSLETCKHLLKSHKLKITQVWPTPEPKGYAETKSTKRKRAFPHPEPAQKKRKVEIVTVPLTSFDQLQSRYGISTTICTNLQEQGFLTPTEIQLGSLPLLLDSHTSSASENGVETKLAAYDNSGPIVDLLAVAPTGSGKTLAFLIPVLNALVRQRQSGFAKHHVHDNSSAESIIGPKALIVAPTKELAGQLVNETRKLAANTAIRVSLIRKGSKVFLPLSESEPNDDDDHISLDDIDDGRSEHEIETDLSGATAVKSEILVSTPLALLHAMKSNKGKALANHSVQFLILDEADVLLDPLFREQTLAIWNSCKSPLLRVSCWSATMGSSIEALALETLKSRWKSIQDTGSDKIAPQRVLRIVVGLKDSAIPNVQHSLVYAGNEHGKLMALRQILRPTTNSRSVVPAIRPPFLVFTQTIRRAIALHSELLYDIPEEAGGSIRLAVLHADLSETARDTVMTRLRNGEIWVLITTDLLSRGVDFKGINGVVNYDFPNSSAVYVHRVGRTGRAGRSGCIAVTLYAKEDIPFLKNVANVIAASQKVRNGQHDIQEQGTGIQKWLIDSLPKPTRHEKQQLKKRGVESRRSGPPGHDSKGVGTRISTRSGYDKRMENRRKGAIEASINRSRQHSHSTTRHNGTADGHLQKSEAGDDDFEDFSD